MSNQKKKGMNLPNKLTVLRICLVPVFIVVMMLPASVLNPIISGLIGVAIFIVASFTDMLDGKIARKYGLVTDFGKFMDPLADKFMVIGAMFVILYRSLTRKNEDGVDPCVVAGGDVGVNSVADHNTLLGSIAIFCHSKP